MYKKKFAIKDSTTYLWWVGTKKDADGFIIESELYSSRVRNAKTFNTRKEAEKEIEIFSVTTGGCKMSHTVLEIVQMYLTNS